MTETFPSGLQVVSVSPSELLLTVLAADLTAHQADAFIDHVIEERTLADVAKEYGCSREAVRHSCDLARQKLQRRFWLEEAA